MRDLSQITGAVCRRLLASLAVNSSTWPLLRELHLIKHHLHKNSDAGKTDETFVTGWVLHVSRFKCVDVLHAAWWTPLATGCYVAFATLAELPDQLADTRILYCSTPVTTAGYSVRRRVSHFFEKAFQMSESVYWCIV